MRQLTVTVSVKPYPSCIVTFPPLWAMNSSNSFFKSTGTESPPAKTPLRQLKSAFFIFLLRSSASYNVGTPAMYCGLCLENCSAKISASNLGTRMVHAPTIMGRCTQTARPNPWNMGRMHIILSCLIWPRLASFICPRHWIARALKLWLESKTPFCIPVVPPVYSTTAPSLHFMDDLTSLLDFSPSFMKFFQEINLLFSS